MKQNKHLFLPRILVSILVIILLFLSITGNNPLNSHPKFAYIITAFFFVLSLIAFYFPLKGGYALQIGSLFMYGILQNNIILYVDVPYLIHPLLNYLSLLIFPFILVGTMFVHYSRFSDPDKN